MSANFIRVVEKKGGEEEGKKKSLLTLFHFKVWIQSLNQGLCAAQEGAWGYNGRQS